MESKTLQITYVKSAIGYHKRQKATIKALGLRHSVIRLSRWPPDPFWGWWRACGTWCASKRWHHESE